MERRVWRRPPIAPEENYDEPRLVLHSALTIRSHKFAGSPSPPTKTEEGIAAASCQNETNVLAIVGAVNIVVCGRAIVDDTSEIG